jgi:hypothetical protein
MRANSPMAGGACRYSWRVPPGLQGQFQVRWGSTSVRSRSSTSPGSRCSGARDRFVGEKASARRRMRGDRLIPAAVQRHKKHSRGGCGAGHKPVGRGHFMKTRYVLLLCAVAAAALAASYLLAQQEGYVAVKTPGVVLQVQSGWMHRMTLRSESGPTVVSARACQPVSLELRWKQAADTWQMWSHDPWRAAVRIKVANADYHHRTRATPAGQTQVAIYGRQVDGRSGHLRAVRRNIRI